MDTLDATPALAPLVPVTPGHGEELADYCRQLYRQHYDHLWYHAGCEWYQAQTFDAAVLEQELANPGIRHFAIHAEGRRVGFMRLVLQSPLDREPGGLEVSRLYLDKDVLRNGLGRRAMEAVVRLGESLGLRYLWLQVMDSSDAAIRFYESLGFERVGDRQLPYVRMKPQFRTILQMRKALDPEGDDEQRI